MTAHFKAALRIDDAEFPVDVVAHDAHAPMWDAPTGDGGSLVQMGRMTVIVPPEHTEHVGAHTDFGQTITLLDRGTETPCVFLMKADGHPGANAYLWLEPDRYFEWDFGVQSET